MDQNHANFALDQQKRDRTDRRIARICTNWPSFSQTQRDKMLEIRWPFRVQDEIQFVILHAMFISPYIMYMRILFRKCLANICFTVVDIWCVPCNHLIKKPAILYDSTIWETLLQHQTRQQYFWSRKKNLGLELLWVIQNDTSQWKYWIIKVADFLLLWISKMNYVMEP